MKEEEKIGKIYMLKDGEMTCLGLNKDIFVPDEYGEFELDNDDRIIAAPDDFNQYYIDKVSNGQPVRLIDFYCAYSDRMGIYIITAADDVYCLRYEAQSIVFEDDGYAECYYGKILHLIKEWSDFTIIDVDFEKIGNLNKNNVSFWFYEKSHPRKFFPYYYIDDRKLKDDIYGIMNLEEPCNKANFEVIYALLKSRDREFIRMMTSRKEQTAEV